MLQQYKMYYTSLLIPFSLRNFRWAKKIHNVLVFQVSFKCTQPHFKAFQGTSDIFNGITVDISKLNINLDDFEHLLKDNIKEWRKENKKCIWFKINIENSQFVPILAKKGFNFHHARNSHVMMYKWLPKNSEPNLPPPCHTNMGVGAMVFNSKEQILAISEANYNYPHWKLPGGYIEHGEDIISAAIREVKEETGVISKFESLVTLRHTHHMAFDNSDIYILLRMSSITDTINISTAEIKDCKWMDIDEYCNHPLVHEWNRYIVKEALRHMKKGLKVDIQKKVVKWATNTREMNVLLVD